MTKLSIIEQLEKKDASSPLTTDYLLGGRVKLQQPKEGFRVAIDSVFLSAAVNAQPNDTVLDVGAGVGAASLCLATRLDQVRVIGVELQRDYVRLCADNIRLNNLNHRLEILNGDLSYPPPRLAAGTFSHVMANPPYHESAHHASPNQAKAQANHEGQTTLEDWVRFCLLMAKPKGIVTFVHKMNRLDELLSLTYGKLGSVSIFPLWAGDGKEAKRYILQGIKGVQGPLKMLPGMILHKSDGRYTDAAEDILRNAKMISFS